MEQVLVKNKLPQLDYELAEALLLEQLQKSEEPYELNLSQKEQKPLKKALFKLYNKGKHNAKYLEELVSVEKAKQRVFSRNYGVF